MNRFVAVVCAGAMCLAAPTISAEEEVRAICPNLTELDRFVGEWIIRGPMVIGEEQEDLSAVASYRWMRNKAFLLLTIQDTETDELAYVAVIGWDPCEECVMSWDFNYEGTVFRYYQNPIEHGWSIKGSGRLSDGGTVEFSGHHTFIDEDTMEYRGSGTFIRNGNEIPVSLEYTAKRLK